MKNRLMKESGIKWLGELPCDWGYKPLKYVADIQTGNTPSMNNQDFYSHEGMDWIKTTNLLGTNGVSDSELKLTTEGIGQARVASSHSILISCIGDVGKIGFVEKDSAYNQQINAVSFNENDVFWKYGMYFLFVQKDQHQYYQNGNVLKILNTENHKKIVISIPPLLEQKKIASFLDEKVQHIDKILEDTRKSIEELKSYKQALITETVTKGLDQNVEMKESGIDWLGYIPQKWNVIPLKYFATVNDDSLTSNTPKELKIKYVDIGSVTFENGISKVEAMSFGQAPSRARRIVKKDDIIVSTVRTYLKAITIIQEDNLIVSTGFAVIRSQIVNPVFLNFSLKSDYFTEMVSTLSTGIAYPSINTEDLMSIKIPIPSLKEQKNIASFLDEKTNHIDKIIRDKHSILEELESYKKSLIYEYVTGKKEVK